MIAFFPECINYIEHYGLRRLTASGRYEIVRPHHSWNSNFNIGRITLYELTSTATTTTSPPRNTRLTATRRARRCSAIRLHPAELRSAPVVPGDEPAHPRGDEDLPRP